MPTSAHPRALSVDHTAENKTNDDGSHTGISASSSEHDNQETNAWSSDYSNSEDEYTILEENAMPVSSPKNGFKVRRNLKLRLDQTLIGVRLNLNRS